MVLSHRGTLWLDTVEERIHLAGVGVNMSIRNWRRDLMQRGLAEDNKEVRESGWVRNRRERERKRCIFCDVSGHESQSGRGVCADYSSQGTYVHTYMGIHLAYACTCAQV